MFIPQDLGLLRPDEMAAAHRQARSLGEFLGFFPCLTHRAAQGRIFFDRVRQHRLPWLGRPRRDQHALAQLRAHMDEFPFGCFQSPCEASVIGDDVVVGGGGVHD